MSRTARYAAICTLVMPLTLGAAEAGPAYEPFPPARASQTLPPDLQRQAAFTVRENGTTEAFLTRWDLESQYGLFTCPSRRLLEVRIREIRAMATVIASDPSNEALKGLQSGLAAIPTAAVNLIEDPVGTFEQAAEGAKRTLGRVGGLFSKRKSTDYEDKGAESFVIASEKRKVAAELGVDVYSSNPKLQQFLSEIAKARRAGGLAVDLAKMAIPGGAGTAVSGLSTTSDMTALLRDRTPAELDDAADDAMSKAGVDAGLRRRFLATRVLSPRHRTVISGVVARLAGVSNVGALVAAAAESRTEAQAFLHEDQSLALLRLHGTGDAIAALDAVGGIVVAFTRSGAMVVPLPVDVIALVPEVEVAANALLSVPGADRAPSRTLSLAGTATPAAIAYLRSRGFEIVQAAAAGGPSVR